MRIEDSTPSPVDTAPPETAPPETAPPRYVGLVRVRGGDGALRKKPVGKEWDSSTGEELTRSRIASHLKGGGRVGLIGAAQEAVCLDVEDAAAAGVKWALGLGDLPDPAASYRSHGGGTHWWYRISRPIEGVSGRKKGLFLPDPRTGKPDPETGEYPHVGDILSQGGYGILWGIASIEELDGFLAALAYAAPIDPAPFELALATHGGKGPPEAEAPQPHTAPPRVTRHRRTQGGGKEANEEATRAHYEDGLREIATAAQGGRNEALNRVAYWCGRRLKDPAMPDRSQIEADLASAALASGLNTGEARATIASGLDSGADNPRTEAEPQESVGHRAADALLGAYTAQKKAPREEEQEAPKDLIDLLPPAQDIDLPAVARLILGLNRDKLAVVTPDPGEPKGEITAMVAQPGGTWSRSPAALRRLINDTVDGLRSAALALEAPYRKYARARVREIARKKDRFAPDRIAANMRPEEARWAFGEADLDSRLDYLPTMSGVVSLREDEVLRGEGALPLAITRTLPVEWKEGATHPQVDGLTAHMDPEVAAYLWAELGYSLHRLPATRRFLLVVGPPAAGKSHLVKAIEGAISPLATRATATLLRPRPGKETTTELAPMLAPTALATLEEPPSVKWDTERVKDITGGGVIGHRGLYVGVESRAITATLVVVANRSVLPKIGLDQKAMCDRVRLIPFPPVPASQRMSTGAAADLYQDPGFRAAVIARLIEEARNRMLGGAPQEPHPPAASTFALKELIAEEGGVPREIASRVRRDPVSFLTSDRVWEAIAALESIDTKQRGVETKRFAGFVRRRYPEFPTKQDIKRVDGKTKRGWKGYRLAPHEDIEADREEEATREEAPTPTASPYPAWAAEAIAAAKAN